jgi:Kef-type K+ transport system membrane component KefB
MPPDSGIPPELDYVILLFALFVLPRFLQRYRLPAAVTSVALGVIAGAGLGLFAQDRTVALLAVLGIVSLFLFAGLELDFSELGQNAKILAQHLALGVAALFGTAVVIRASLDLPWRPAMLVALALLTPSTGFILDSLASLHLTPHDRFWIKSKAVATELVALAVLFATLQSATWQGLGTSTAVLAAMVLFLPMAFRVFAERIVPYAPKSEFAFLLMLAVLCAFVTRRLGLYYLVGAFIVGIAAQRFQERLPAIASRQMLHAVEVFASFFVPFYFFHAGLELRREDFGGDALVMGGAFLVAALPLRVGLVALHRRLALREHFADGARIGLAMLPTLVFTLVIAQILRDQFQVPRSVFGGLIIYTLVNTLIPGFALRLPPPELHVRPAQESGTPLEPGPVSSSGL